MKSIGAAAPLKAQAIGWRTGVYLVKFFIPPPLPKEAPSQGAQVRRRREGVYWA